MINPPHLDSSYKNYLNRFTNVLNHVQHDDLLSLLDFLSRISSADGIIYVAGNGGSFSIAEHFCCDYNKGSIQSPSTLSKHKAIHLGSMAALQSASENDYGHDEAFSWQISHFGKVIDGLLLISSSGNSRNLINASNIASQLKIETFSLVGFDGGELKKTSNRCLHIKEDNYGLIEDAHMFILHFACQFRSKDNF